jgi:aspartate carbamoyltransferase regulatory subunit
VVAPPAEILGHVKCRNPNCITNNERGMRTHFKATRRDPHLYRCVFCERVFPLSELEMTVS